MSLMSGTLELRSVLGQGTTFYFTLPMMSPYYADEVMEHISSIKQKTVLLIDENEISGKLLLEQMQAWQLKPKWVKNMTEIGQCDHDFVVVDECFYQHHPDEFERFIASHNKKQNFRLIMLCNISSSAKLLQTIEHRDCLTLAKPVRQSALLSSLLGAELASISRKTKNNLYDYKVLLAEDNEVNQEIASLMLKSLGCSVVVAADGVEAFQEYSRHSFDIIFMDFHMPVMDGINSTKKIRELEQLNGV